MKARTLALGVTMLLLLLLMASVHSRWNLPEQCSYMLFACTLDKEQCPCRQAAIRYQCSLIRLCKVCPGNELALGRRTL